MTCNADSCGRSAYKRGLCGVHYHRWRNYGDPLAGGTEKGALGRWLQKNKNFTGDECLVWPFGSKGNGYGHIIFQGKRTSAHRAMCIVAHGQPGEGTFQAAHSCGNGHLGCVNPKHLRWATRAENALDAIRDGRTQRGEKQHGAKLSADQVLQIRKKLQRGLSQSSLATEYGVTRGAIQGIKRGSTWKWLGVTVDDLTSNERRAA